MKHCLFAACALYAGMLFAAPEAGSTAEINPNVKRWMFTPDPKLPNVLLIGDSISIGYTLDVRKALAGKANVYRPMKEQGPANCNGTTCGLKELESWLGTNKWAVIHFNFGLHDLKHVATPGSPTATSNPTDPRQAAPEVYAANLEKIVTRLEKTGARLVFATTTPIQPGTNKPLREPEKAVEYNAIAVKIMENHRVAVNDLHRFILPRLEELQKPKDVHFTGPGSKVLGTEIAQKIQAMLPAAR